MQSQWDCRISYVILPSCGPLVSYVDTCIGHNHVSHIPISPGQFFNISSQYQYQSKTDYTIITIFNSQYIEYSIYRLSAFSRVSSVTSICSTTMVGLKWGSQSSISLRFPVGLDT